MICLKRGEKTERKENWMFLHFYYSDSVLHRDDWEDIYHMLKYNDGINTAIKNARRRMADFNGRRDKPSEYDPGTMVYRLVEELKVYLDED